MTTIYGICDAKTNDVMYVGQTKQTIRNRLNGHKTKAKVSNSEFYVWFRNN